MGEMRMFDNTIIKVDRSPLFPVQSALAVPTISCKLVDKGGFDGDSVGRQFPCGTVLRGGSEEKNDGEACVEFVVLKRKVGNPFDIRAGHSLTLHDGVGSFVGRWVRVV